MITTKKGIYRLRTDWGQFIDPPNPFGHHLVKVVKGRKVIYYNSISGYFENDFAFHKSQLSEFERIIKEN